MPALRQINSPEPPSELCNYIQTVLSLPDQRMRRRAVLNPAMGGWQLVCCTAEFFPDLERAPKPAASRHYNDCILFEDWLDLDACRAFLSAVDTGRIALGEIEVARSVPNSVWHLERVTLDNYYMPAAGLVARTRFEQHPPLSQEPLISFSAPYYPNELEALRDWISSGRLYSDADGRNGEVLFLLPETRAFFVGLHSDNGLLRIDIGGTHRDTEGFKVAGAYWQDDVIHHFSPPVVNGSASASVPDHVTRLECILIDADANVYDRYFEHNGRDSGLQRQRNEDHSERLKKLLKTALSRGEGSSVEFKPLVEVGEGLGDKRRKTKYREIVCSVVSFANANGGCVFLGVDDNCNVVGVTDRLAEMTKSVPTESELHTYCGALRNNICGDVVGEIDIRITPLKRQSLTVLVVEVAEARSKPLMVRGENSYYLRVGASNRQLPANEWANHVGNARLET